MAELEVLMTRINRSRDLSDQALASVIDQAEKAEQRAELSLEKIKRVDELLDHADAARMAELELEETWGAIASALERAEAAEARARAAMDEIAG